MTKKHFIALADKLRMMDVNHKKGKVDFGTVVGYMADFCAEQNPRFNRARWLGYIAGTNGKNGGKVN